MDGIFSGIRILDLTRVVAGPLCTQYFADLGATVYKIEKPGEGDDTRRMGPFMPDAQGQDSNDSALFMAYNRGKRSVTLDIAAPEGAALAQELARHCDVVIENYKVGTLRRYGLDYDTLRAGRDDLVYCSVTGFGQSGPTAARPAYDFILQGMAGNMSTCGQPDGSPGGEPMRTAIPITDVVTGLNATVAIASALFHRQQTGQGQYIDCAMLDSAVALNGHLALGYLMTGKSPTRVGNTNPIASPSEVLPCADGHLIVAAGNNGQFESLCKVLGLAGLPQDERFSTNARRVANRQALRECIGPRVLGWKKDELLAAFEVAGVPGGPINTMEQVFADPQARHRELALSLRHGRGVDVPSVRSPLRFSATPVQHLTPPCLGEHTESVLRDMLGVDAAGYAALRAQRVV